MRKITLYHYVRPDGGTTVSPVKPDGMYIELFRLVADEGMILTDGTVCTPCVDTGNVSQWSEVKGSDCIEEITFE